MGLYAEVYVADRVNGRLDIGHLEIVRRSGKAEEDSVNRYLVRLDGEDQGFVEEHRYGDGAWKLVAKAMEIAKLT